MTDKNPTPIRRRTVTAALLAGLSTGCLRLDGDESTTVAPNRTAGRTDSTAPPTADTPTSEPTDEPEPTATPEPTMTLPPGLSEDGVTKRLGQSHHEAALEQSFTTTHEHTFGGAFTATTHRIDPEESQYRQLRDQGSDVLEEFGAGDTNYARGEFEDVGTLYGVSSATLQPSSSTFQRTHEDVLSTGAYELSATHPDRTPKTAEIVANDVDDPSTYRNRYPIDSFRSLTGGGVVRESGLIETLDFEAVVRSNDEDVTFRKFVETSDVGETTVDQPDWTATAAEESPTLELEQTGDDLVRVDHRGGHTVPVNSTLFFSLETDGYIGDTEFELSEGDTYYLYAAEDDGAGTTVRIVRDPSNADDPVPLDDSFPIKMAYLGVTFVFEEV